MKRSLILASILALGVGLTSQAAVAQTDQSATTAPYATATDNTGAMNPGATANPMATATAGPVVNNNYPVSNGGNAGWWGLIGLIGLLGLFGGRRRTTID